MIEFATLNIVGGNSSSTNLEVAELGWSFSTDIQFSNNLVRFMLVISATEEQTPQLCILILPTPGQMHDPVQFILDSHPRREFAVTTLP